MTTKLIRHRLSSPLVMFGGMVLGMMILSAAPSFAQDLFGEQEMKPPLTEEQQAAGERESIF